MQQSANLYTRYKRRKFNSIQSKLTLIFVLILTPVVVLLSFLSFRNAQTLLKNRAFELVESIISIKQEQIDNTIDEYKNITRELTSEIQDTATQSGINNIALFTQTQNLLSNSVKQHSDFKEIQIVNSKGEIKATSKFEDVGNFSDLENIEINELTDFQIKDEAGSLLILFPVIYEDNKQHTLKAYIKLDKIRAITEDYVGLGSSGEILLGRRSGNKIVLINHPRNPANFKKENIVQNNINPRSPIVLATQNLSGTEATQDYGGKDVIAAYGNPSVKGWGLVVKLDSQEVFSPIQNLKRELIGVSTLIIVLFILVAFVVSRTIIEPLTKLQKGAEEIAKGKWDYQLNINTGDEVELLAQEFKRMAVELGGLYGKLEQRVKVRTSELEKEKETSERLADELKIFLQAVENASDQIIITDSEGKIIYTNQATESNTKFSRIEVVGQKPGKKLWGGMMDEKFYKHMWTTIKTRKQKWQGEVTNKKKNQKKYIAALSISPILNVSGEVKNYVGIERDITREKAVDKMKTEFISVASHQLRTPLSAVRWFAEMLISGDAGKVNKEQNEYLQHIYDSNDRMIELVNALLNVSRIEQGRITVEPEPTDLIKLVDQVIIELTPKIKEKKLHIIVSKHDNLPKISIDPKLVRQVYANLISNSVKYTPENGEVTILISKKGDDIISQIQDNGYGIPEEQQGRIFSKFFRADNIRTVTPDGTGLGLYIVKSVVESSGGKIWFESEEEKGTTFWFTLPLSGTAPRKGERTLEDSYL